MNIKQIQRIIGKGNELYSELVSDVTLEEAKSLLEQVEKTSRPPSGVGGKWRLVSSRFHLSNIPVPRRPSITEAKELDSIGAIRFDPYLRKWWKLGRLILRFLPAQAGNLKGFGAINLGKTHCPQNHPLPEKRNSRGERVCVLCRREASKRYRAKLRARNQALLRKQSLTKDFPIPPATPLLGDWRLL